MKVRAPDQHHLRPAVTHQYLCPTNDEFVETVIVKTLQHSSAFPNLKNLGGARPSRRAPSTIGNVSAQLPRMSCPAGREGVGRLLARGWSSEAGPGAAHEVPRQPRARLSPARRHGPRRRGGEAFESIETISGARDDGRVVIRLHRYFRSDRCWTKGRPLAGGERPCR